MLLKIGLILLVAANGFSSPMAGMGNTNINFDLCSKRGANYWSMGGSPLLTYTFSKSETLTSGRVGVGGTAALFYTVNLDECDFFKIAFGPRVSGAHWNGLGSSIVGALNLEVTMLLFVFGGYLGPENVRFLTSRTRLSGGGYGGIRVPFDSNWSLSGVNTAWSVMVLFLMHEGPNNSYIAPTVEFRFHF